MLPVKRIKLERSARRISQQTVETISGVPQPVISLAEMSNRLNTMCLFDEKTRTVTNGEGKKITPITYGTMAES